MQTKKKREALVCVLVAEQKYVHFLSVYSVLPASKESP